MDKEQSYRWLRFGDFKGGSESTIVAAQDQALNTNCFKKKFKKKKLKYNVDYVKNTE
jgi:hypothetical protein